MTREKVPSFHVIPNEAPFGFIYPACPEERGERSRGTLNDVKGI